MEFQSLFSTIQGSQLDRIRRFLKERGRQDVRRVMVDFEWVWHGVYRVIFREDRSALVDLVTGETFCMEDMEGVVTDQAVVFGVIGSHGDEYHFVMEPVVVNAGNIEEITELVPVMNRSEREALRWLQNGGYSEPLSLAMDAWALMIERGSYPLISEPNLPLYRYAWLNFNKKLPASIQPGSVAAALESYYFERLQFELKPVPNSGELIGKYGGIRKHFLRVKSDIANYFFMSGGRKTENGPESGYMPVNRTRIRYDARIERLIQQFASERDPDRSFEKAKLVLREHPRYIPALIRIVEQLPDESEEQLVYADRLRDAVTFEELQLSTLLRLPVNIRHSPHGRILLDGFRTCIEHPDWRGPSDYQHELEMLDLQYEFRVK